MQWFFLSILGPFLWSLVNINDQYLVRKFGEQEEHGPGALVLFSSLIGLIIVGFILLFFKNIHFLNVSFTDILLLLFIGFLNIFWVIFYLYAINENDVSSVVPWFLLSPVFSLVLGFFFLGENFGLKDVFGFVIILISLFIISIDFKDLNKINLKKSLFIYMLPASFIVSLITFLFKFVTIKDENFWVSSFWVYLGLGISGIFIFIFSKNYRKSFFSMINKGGMKIFSINIISEIISVLGNLANSFATLIAPIALVSAVSSFQPAILFILTIILSRFSPFLFKEHFSKEILIPKICALFLLTLGSVIVLF